MTLNVDIPSTGPVLDALLAVTVMGWTKQTQSPFGWQVPGDGTILRQDWKPSSHVENAFEAMTEATKTGVTRWNIEWNEGSNDYTVTVKLQMGPNDMIATAPTAASVLAESALLVHIELNP